MFNSRDRSHLLWNSACDEESVKVVKTLFNSCLVEVFSLPRKMFLVKGCSPSGAAPFHRFRSTFRTFRLPSPRAANVLPNPCREVSMVIGKFRQVLLLSSLVCLVSLAATGQSFRVQCPATTSIHPTVLPSGSAEPAFTGPTSTTAT